MRYLLLSIVLAAFISGCKSDTVIVDPGPEVTERWKIAWTYEVVTDCVDTTSFFRPYASKFIVLGTSNVGLDRHGAIVIEASTVDAVTTDSVIECPQRSSIEVTAPEITRASAPISAAVTGGFYPLGETQKDSVVLNVSALYQSAVVKYSTIKPLATTRYDTLGLGTVAMNIVVTDVRDGGSVVKSLQPFSAASHITVRATITKLPL